MLNQFTIQKIIQDKPKTSIKLSLSSQVLGKKNEEERGYISS